MMTAWDWERVGGVGRWEVEEEEKVVDWEREWSCGGEGEREEGMECLSMAVFMEMDPREAMDSSSWWR